MGGGRLVCVLVLIMLVVLVVGGVWWVWCGGGGMYVCMCMYVYVCVCKRQGIQAPLHTYTAYLHTCIHTYMHTYRQASKQATNTKPPPPPSLSLSPSHQCKHHEYILANPRRARKADLPRQTSVTTADAHVWRKDPWVGIVVAVCRLATRVWGIR